MSRERIGKACKASFIFAAMLALVPAAPARSEPGGNAGPAASGKGRAPDLWERMSFSADMRLRHESNFSLDDQPDRDRDRLRFRIGATFEISGELLAGARMITGNPDDPRSPHQTLGEANDSWDISLDRVWLEYRPRWAEGLKLTGGKFDHAFYRNPVYGELVWDADVQPEGAAARYVWKSAGSGLGVEISAGKYVLVEQQRASEASAAVAQAVLRTRLGPRLEAVWALGWYGYTDTSPDGSAALLADNNGNALSLAVDPNDPNSTIVEGFLSDFDIVHPVVAFIFDLGGIPLTVAGESMRNAGAEGGRDAGWGAGFRLGRDDDAHDWQVWYQRQIVEQDAVFSPVAQDDFLFGTNHRTHAGGVRYRFLKPAEVHLWALVSRRDVLSPGDPAADSDRSQWRVRLDLNFRL